MYALIYSPQFSTGIEGCVLVFYYVNSYTLNSCFIPPYTVLCLKTNYIRLL